MFSGGAEGRSDLVEVELLLTTSGFGVGDTYELALSGLKEVSGAT